MMLDECGRAEITAGALAIGEATDAQRDDYRRHLSRCNICLTTLGGERDIERTMRLVARARDEESWTPEARVVIVRQTDFKRRVWQFGLAAAAALAILWLGARALIPNAPQNVAERMGAVHQSRIVMPQVKRHAAAGHDLVVVHNVATLKRPPLTTQAHVAPKALARAHEVPAAPSARNTNTAVTVVAAAALSQRDERSVSALRTVGTAPPQPGRAESIAVLPAPGISRDVAPLGGESAIVPHPPAIAYYENAEGTTAFDVSVDEHGVPLKCTVARSSGFVVLDEAVCQAAMRARYAPRLINGHAVAGVYHDSLTFQTGDNR
jgi:TonB family protein